MARTRPSTNQGQLFLSLPTQVIILILFEGFTYKINLHHNILQIFFMRENTNGCVKIIVTLSAPWLWSPVIKLDHFEAKHINYQVTCMPIYIFMFKNEFFDSYQCHMFENLQYLYTSISAEIFDIKCAILFKSQIKETCQFCIFWLNIPPLLSTGPLLQFLRCSFLLFPGNDRSHSERLTSQVPHLPLLPSGLPWTSLLVPSSDFITIWWWDKHWQTNLQIVRRQCGLLCLACSKWEPD